MELVHGLVTTQLSILVLCWLEETWLSWFVLGYGKLQTVPSVLFVW